MKINIINNSKNDLPQYSVSGSAGVDLRANLEKGVWLPPSERFLIPTGLHIELPVGYEAQIRPRSGLAFKHGVTVLNSPGTIDSEYTGEIKAILINHSKTPFRIENGDRICQMVIAKHEVAEWNLVKKLGDTVRGDKGMGSTGVK